jgi:hypothetical protein
MLHIPHNTRVLSISSLDKDNQTGIFQPVPLPPFLFMTLSLVPLPSQIAINLQMLFCCAPNRSGADHQVVGGPLCGT